MNKVSQVKSSIHKERWLSIIKECQSSGMTIRAWCKQNNIKEATYYMPMTAHTFPELLTTLTIQSLAIPYPEEGH